MKKDQYFVALRPPQLLLFNGFKFKVLKIVLFLSLDVLMSPFLFSSKYKLKWALCVYSSSQILGRCLISIVSLPPEEFQVFCFGQNDANIQLCTLKSELKQN